METLEELKAIVENAPERATHVGEDSKYLKFRKNNDWFEYSNSFSGHSVIYTQNLDNARSLSDIERIIELMEKLEGSGSIKDECEHRYCTAQWGHVQCDSCGYVLTDGGFGCASRKWFPNIEAAKFCQKNGFLPSEFTGEEK